MTVSTFPVHAVDLKNVIDTKNKAFCIAVTKDFAHEDIKNLLPFFVIYNELVVFIKQKKFIGDKNDILAYPIIVDGAVNYCILLGMGSAQIDCLENSKKCLKNALGILYVFLEKQNIGYCALEMQENVSFGQTSEFAELVSTTMRLADYSFSKKSTPSKKIDLTLALVYRTDDAKNQFIAGNARGEIISDCINQTRLWSDLPPSDLYPKVFAQQAEALIKNNKHVSVTVLDKSTMQGLGMGGVLGVCNGSMHDPYMIIAEYKPEAYTKTIALVGKGVTFDSGGISIKPADSMEEMKHDMSGAAAVIGAFHALCKLGQTPYRIIMCAPMVENMVSGEALKPGDIITFYNKKTAEIKNTDAEGRLILADALSYISDIYKPDVMIDLATLTGACSVALGPIFAAVLSKHNKLVQSIRAAGEESGDRCWELPLDDEYKKAIDTPVADLCNIGSREFRAGTITAAWFLKHFVDDAITWAHLDIAGVSYKPVGKTYLAQYNATGFGVALLVELLSTDKYIK